jgi:carboxylesterase type B
MSQGGTPNAGLHDQRLALAWVQDYIEEFGGNRDR